MTNEKTVIIGSNKKPLHLNKEALQKIATKAGFGVAGIAGGVGISALFMGMAPNDPETHTGKVYEKPDVDLEPKEITSVNDDMSFGEAFKTARHEAGGPNGYFVWHGKVFETIYKEEIDKLSPEEKHTMYAGVMEKYGESNHPNTENNSTVHHHIDSPVIVLHDEAPVATHVADDMSFKDAFAVAREEVGPGGVFEWHGKSYNTYTTEETNAMTAEQKHDFIASVGNTEIEDHSISTNDVDIVKIDGGNSTVPTTESETTTTADQWVDDGTGNKIHMAHFLVNGEHIVKVDQDGDGNFDLTMKPNEDGSVHMVTADGQEANLSQEDMMQFQQQIVEADNNNFTDDNINLETDHNAHLSNMEDY
jgi:hypothetical protein